jgi:hypothetical protein
LSICNTASGENFINFAANIDPIEIYYKNYPACYPDKRDGNVVLRLHRDEPGEPDGEPCKM